MTEFKFLKAHGLGNDFVIFTKHSKLNISKKLVKFLSDRKKGVGCDLTVFLNKSENNYSDLVARFFNKDGSEAEVCGNALRCIGNYYFKKFNKKNVTVETNSGLIDVEKNISEKISVDLGKPNISWEKIPIKIDVDTQNLDFDFDYLKGGFAVNVGNPHVIFFGDNLNESELKKDSEKIIKTNFFPNGVNVSIVKVLSRSKVNILTYERGVGITDACGSGAGASVFASNKLNFCDKNVEVSMAGGNLFVEITRDEHILTIGEAKDVFVGQINLKDYVL
ncbi:MAG: diaminopimelate epimerase [Alphaproteobacteria bacterium]|nr:MAG: diaminopimelate epimerase [Alphaproteobacteria bacterium]